VTGGRSVSGQTVRALFRAPSGVSATVAVGCLAVLAIVGPLVWGSDANRLDLTSIFQGPSHAHFLGTDSLGRDILSRTLAAARLSLEMAVVATLIAVTLGLPVGAGISLLGPRMRTVGMRGIDVLLSFPDLLLALFIVAIIGPSIKGAVVAVGVAFAPGYMRMAATLASSAAGKDYIASARVVGVSRYRLLSRYIIPNIGEPIVIAIFVDVGSALIAVSSLSFLGLGVQPPQFDWGRMLTEGVRSFYVTPMAALAPAILIAATGLAMGFVGEALARAMNPLLWTAPPRRGWRMRLQPRDTELGPERVQRTDV
jgi:ABC-type dipeptide/oligopeptide/nickel transport system permease subunit